jgi:hypothetical protein
MVGPSEHGDLIHCAACESHTHTHTHTRTRTRTRTPTHAHTCTHAPLYDTHVTEWSRSNKTQGGGGSHHVAAVLLQPFQAAQLGCRPHLNVILDVQCLSAERANTSQQLGWLTMRVHEHRQHEHDHRSTPALMLRASNHPDPQPQPCQSYWAGRVWTSM